MTVGVGWEGRSWEDQWTMGMEDGLGRYLVFEKRWSISSRFRSKRFRMWNC